MSVCECVHERVSVCVRVCVASKAMERSIMKTSDTPLQLRLVDMNVRGFRAAQRI